MNVKQYNWIKKSAQNIKRARRWRIEIPPSEKLSFAGVVDGRAREKETQI